jgi:hypothetical protein
VDYRGQTCTLYFAEWQQNAVRPTEFDPQGPADSFQKALAGGLTKAGLDVGMPVAVADAPLVIRPTILRADPGSRNMRWFFTFLAGYAVFEAGGQMGTSAAPFGQFHGKGVRRWGFYGGDSRTLLNDAARMAGLRAAAQILGVLAVR